ncbi:MAG: dUTP diphosphatase, partial [Gammaproteobacteria bacterium]
GWALGLGLTVLNSRGTIDCDYRGEIRVLLINHGLEAATVTRGQRIAQLVVAPVGTIQWIVTSELPLTSRATGAFGHTGSSQSG